jgi:GntR family transcriptional regulator, rspAB operon transcriptional repressor
MLPKKQPSPSRESDRIEAELRRLILTLELEPGLAISESTLMQRYGWGRTPLREAFQRLAEQSLLQIIPRQGAVVTALSVFDFIEMMDAMSLVIGPAAALACKRLSEQDLAQLDTITAKAETSAASGDFATLADLDYEFHRILAVATGNRYLSNYLLHLHQVATRFNYAAWKRDGSAHDSIREHEQIISTLRKREPAQARAVMLQHIEGARQRVIGIINTEE